MLRETSDGKSFSKGTCEHCEVQQKQVVFLGELACITPEPESCEVRQLIRYLLIFLITCFQSTHLVHMGAVFLFVCRQGLLQLLTISVGAGCLDILQLHAA